MPRSHVTEDLPSSPPPEVLDEVFAAWERAQEPLPESLALHFVSEPVLGRAWGELRLDDGTFLASISASEALAIACGDASIVPSPVLVQICREPGRPVRMANEKQTSPSGAPETVGAPKPGDPRGVKSATAPKPRPKAEPAEPRKKGPTSK